MKLNFCPSNQDVIYDLCSNLLDAQVTDSLLLLNPTQLQIGLLVSCVRVSSCLYSKSWVIVPHPALPVSEARNDTSITPSHDGDDGREGQS